MQTIVITGSPGAGKTSISNELSEKLRESNIPHTIIDPDEIARIFPERSLSQLKWDALARLYPLYVENKVSKIIIPVTVDDNSDLEEIHKIFGEENVEVFSLIVDESILVERVVAREPNEYWQKTLSDLVRAYVRNGDSRSFSSVEITVGDSSIVEICDLILKKILK